MSRGTLFVISAPSGAGKSSLIGRLRAKFPDMLYSVSCTTRSPRPDEREGESYYFLSRDQFRTMANNNGFLEWKEVHRNLYGTPRSPVLEAMEHGRRMVLDIDVQGALEVFSNITGTVGIFVSAPNMDVLAMRLRSRATESEENIRLRLENAENEMYYAGRFDYHIVNDDLEEAALELETIIEKESRCHEAGKC